MKEKGHATVILHFIRAVALVDLAIFALVGLICLIIGWRTLHEYGTALTWAGVIVMLAGGLTVMGGYASRAEDVTAFSLTGAGAMSEHLKRISEATTSRFGCVMLLLVAAIVPLAVGLVLEFVFGPSG